MSDGRWHPPPVVEHVLWMYCAGAVVGILLILAWLVDNWARDAAGRPMKWWLSYTGFALAAWPFAVALLPVFAVAWGIKVGLAALYRRAETTEKPSPQTGV